MWKSQWTVFINREILLKGFLWQKVFQAGGKNETQAIIKCYQPLIKGGVMQAGKAEAVSNIKTRGWIFCPRNNMRGHKQFAHGQAAYAAGAIKIVEDDLAKIVLSEAAFLGRGCLGRLVWSGRAADDSFGGNDFNGACISWIKEPAQHGFTFGNHRGEGGMKFVPCFAIQHARAGQSADAAQFQRGIKRGKVAKFHRETSGGTPKFSGKVDDGAITGIKLSEVQFVVEVESDEQFIASPLFAGSHAGTIENSLSLLRQ